MVGIRVLVAVGLWCMCVVGEAEELPVPAPGDAFETVTEDGAWCWFQDPRALNHNGKTYLGWVTAKNGGEVQIALLDHDTGATSHATLGQLHRDDHANPALHILPDGRLVVFYSAHNGKDMFYRVSHHPEDISEWSEERTTGVNTPGGKVTYPNPVQLSGEANRLYLFWRGGDHQPAYSFTDDLDTWAPARSFVQAGQAPYMKVATDGRSTIHFAFTNDHPEYASDNNVYYFAYRAGRLQRADGTVVGTLGGTPVRPDQTDLVYDSSWKNRRAWIWDVAEDSEGRPVLVFSASTHPTDHDRRYGRPGEPGWRNHYYYARWDGARWQHFRLVDAGPWFPETPEGAEEVDPYYTGGIVLDHSDPARVYLSRKLFGQFEIERWETPDGGQTWRSWPITANSAKRNVRPVVPQGPHYDGASVLWMYGDYRTFTDFATAIKRGF